MVKPKLDTTVELQSSKRAEHAKSNSSNEKKPIEKKRMKPDGVLPNHLLLRVRSEEGQTVTEHSAMIKNRGKAMLGKLGQAIGPDLIAALKKQISEGIPTYLFLTLREGWNGPYVTYKCTLLDLHLEISEDQELFAPRYYKTSWYEVSTWFEIKSMEKMNRDDMNRIYVLSSGREIMSVIKSSASVFRVGWPEPS